MKRFLSLLLAAVLALGLVGTAAAASVDDGTESGHIFYVNGEQVEGMSFRSFDGVLYGSVRGFFENVLDEVKVTWASKQAKVTGVTADGEELTLTAKPGSCYMQVNGRCLYAEKGIMLKGGVTLAPMSLLTAVFPESTFEWDEEAGAGYLTLKGGLLPSGEAYYNARDLDMIARVVSCEAGNQCLEGQIAVANVILNRVASDRFPNNVYDVLYAPNQFTIVNYPMFQNAPSETGILAAKLALEGANMVPGAVYYCQKWIDCWMTRCCPLLTTIEDHAFFGM